MNGAEATAGSTFNLLNSKGNADPISVATPILQIKVTDTILENKRL